MNAQVLGISVDHLPCLIAWAKDLGGINYHLLSDFWPHGHVAQLYGVLRPEGYTERAIYILDEQGIIQYVDIHDINKQPDNEVLFNELARIRGDSPPDIENEPDLPHGGVVMYCTPWCPSCGKVRYLFKANEVEYTLVDVSTNLKAARQVRAWADGNIVSPTFDIDGTILVGFNEEELYKVLKAKNYVK